MDILQTFFHWFYCLPVWGSISFLILATILFMLLRRRLCGAFWWNALIGIALVCWIFAAISATVGLRVDGQTNQHIFTPFHSYREVWSGGNPEIYRSNFMNVLLFYPAGLLTASLLPEKWTGWCRCILVVLLLAAMSAGIEFVQYRYALGRCEIDDVIHNTAGALIGSLIVILSRRCDPSS